MSPLCPVDSVRIAGTIWFQGENDQGEGSPDDDYAFPYYNCGMCHVHECIIAPNPSILASVALRALIEHTRLEFASPASQWSTVQLAPYITSWEVAPFRAMQCNATLTQSNASCVRIVDDGDPLSPIGSVHR